MKQRNPHFSLASVSVGVLLLVGAAGSVLAQSAPLQPAPVARFAVKGFSVQGENPLGADRTAAVLAPYARADATLETLQQAAAALEAALREAGYGLYRVALQPQEVGQTVKLNVVHFVVGSVTVSGASQYDEANIRRSLPELREGVAPNFRRLAVQTAIANENPGKQTQVGLREADSADRVDATVLVKENRPLVVTAGINNTGTAETGRDRSTLALTHANVFKLDHQMSAAFTTSLANPSRVKQYGLSYRVPFYAAGGVLGASATRSDVIGNFGSFSSTGAGHTLGVNYTHYLAPQKSYRAYVTLALDDKVFNPMQLNGQSVVGQVVRRSRQISLAYTARREAATAQWSYSGELATNMGGGSGNDLASYQSEDPRISTSRWKAVRASATYVGSFSNHWQMLWRSALQYSPDALIAAEQFGLGGANSVRGTRERPIAGDRGLSTSLEMLSPDLRPGLRGLAFVDAGWLSNVNVAGSSKLSNDSLASAGMGLRYTSQQISVSAEYGRLVSGSRLPLSLNSAAPQKGDQKLHVQLTARF